MFRFLTRVSFRNVSRGSNAAKRSFHSEPASTIVNCLLVGLTGLMIIASTYIYDLSSKQVAEVKTLLEVTEEKKFLLEKCKSLK